MFKEIKVTLGFIALFILVSSLFVSSVSAATVGQQLSVAESGWQRIDDADKKISYNGGQWKEETGPNFFGNTLHFIPNNPTDSSQSVTFTFYGTQLRIIGTMYQDYTTKLIVTIDGVDYSPANSSGTATPVNKALVFGVENLKSGKHTVQIKSTDTKRWVLDAIDIDQTGYLINQGIASPILSAQAQVAKVDLNWTSVSNAVTYNVKRSLTSGGPFETIATVTSTTYTDIDVINGITYYYEITAANEDGDGAPSNQVSATPQAQIAIERAIFKITFNTGLEKEYDLSMTDVNAFIKWYEEKASGTGPIMFAINKLQNNIGQFNSRKDYIIFDKIITFEVNEYTPVSK